MSDFWKERIPESGTLIAAALSFVVPWLVYRINRLLHKHMDPPWMKAEDAGSKRNAPSPKTWGEGSGGRGGG